MELLVFQIFNHPMPLRDPSVSETSLKIELSPASSHPFNCRNMHRRHHLPSSVSDAWPKIRSQRPLRTKTKLRMHYLGYGRPISLVSLALGTYYQCPTSRWLPS
ncbi:uncharacterized protein PV07_05850 [Cladophialophora immunda]|uniref:Uncharacterized protein n=1 Tax=Cladophialophora immunda TaxID=569365 RepID=A0A0D2D2Z7_9EURO|nr:uncharacterized protein PV07_05850 [Cladophialophora immunda]KIW30074.1 hypothetical protein PV07_05850 [Cladophialophora immunda]